MGNCRVKSDPQPMEIITIGRRVFLRLATIDLSDNTETVFLFKASLRGAGLAVFFAMVKGLRSFKDTQNHHVK